MVPFIKLCVGGICRILADTSTLVDGSKGGRAWMWFLRLVFSLLTGGFVLLMLLKSQYKQSRDILRLCYGYYMGQSGD